MLQMDGWQLCQYFGYWDVPRQLVLMRDDDALFLDCAFDEGLDDYPLHYQVWTLESINAAQLLELSWESLQECRSQRIAEIPVAALEFAQPRERRNGRHCARYRFREC